MYTDSLRLGSERILQGFRVMFKLVVIMEEMKQQANIDRLVRESQKGDTQAFGELYDTFFTQIHKYVYYKVSEEYVDDLVATVFIKAWTQIKKYQKSKHPFSSWLFRIAHNAVIDHYRTNKQHYELQEQILDDVKPIPSDLANQQLNGERVHRAVRKLEKKYQEVIVLKFLNELPNAEVAKAVGTSEANVRTLQFRALKKLKSMLEEEDLQIEQRLLEADQLPAEKGFFKRLFVRSS